MDAANEARKKKFAQGHMIMKFKRRDAIAEPLCFPVPQAHLGLGT